jgi:hypothetical protein
MRSVMALTAAVLLMISAAMGQPIFVERIVYQRPAPAVMEPTGRVAELIGRLADASAETRRMAASELLKMGTAVEPQVRWARQQGESGGKALSWNMLHVREGNKWVQDPRHLRPWHAENELDVLISHLEEDRSSQTSMITLRYKDAPLTNVLCDFGMQAEADVTIGGWYWLPEIDTARTTINLDGKNFWGALEAIRKSTGLVTTHGNAQNRLVLSKGFSSRPTNVIGAVVSGVIQIVPISAERESSGVGLTLAAFAEPRFSQTGPHAMVRINECVDDRGESLIANGKQNFASVESYNTWTWTIPIELTRLADNRRIKVIRGNFSVGIGPMQRDMTITNVMRAQDQSREFDGVKVTVTRVTVSDSQHGIDVELSAPAESPYTRTFSASSELEVWVWDESRKTIVSEKVFNGVRREAGRDIASWRLIAPPNGPAPVTLVWRTPAETRWHTAPFELSNIAVAGSAKK